MTLHRYPKALRPPLIAGQSRTQAATFEMSEPRTGPPYRKRKSKDTPVFWNVTFRFKDDERIIFWAWFKHKIDGGNLNFIMPINTEEGIVDHECWFTEDGIPQQQPDSPRIFSYRARIGSRQLKTPLIDDISEMNIDEFPELYSQREFLDRIANRTWLR